jgi:hypothetical protein
MSTTYNPEKLAEAEEALRMSIVSLAGVLTEKHLLRHLRISSNF